MEGTTGEVDLNAGFVGLLKGEVGGRGCWRSHLRAQSGAFLEGMFECQVTRNFLPSLACHWLRENIFLSCRLLIIFQFNNQIQCFKETPT